MISIFFNLLRLALWCNLWYNLENDPWTFKRNEYYIVAGYNVAYMALDPLSLQDNSNLLFLYWMTDLLRSFIKNQTLKTNTIIVLLFLTLILLIFVTYLSTLILVKSILKLVTCSGYITMFPSLLSQTLRTVLLVCLRPEWVCCMNLTKNGGEWDMRHTHRHTDIQQKSWGWEGGTFMMGNVSAYLSHSVYFIRSVQGKDSGKNQALTILDTR
jgi:hypothetical protein